MLAGICPVVSGDGYVAVSWLGGPHQSPCGDSRGVPHISMSAGQRIPPLSDQHILPVLGGNWCSYCLWDRKPPRHLWWAVRVSNSPSGDKRAGQKGLRSASDMTARKDARMANAFAARSCPSPRASHATPSALRSTPPRTTTERSATRGARLTRCSPTPARSQARDNRPRLNGARPRPAARMTRIHRLGRTRPHFRR